MTCPTTIRSEPSFGNDVRNSVDQVCSNPQIRKASMQDGMQDDGMQDDGMQDDGMQDDGMQDDGMQDDGMQDDEDFMEDMHHAQQVQAQVHDEMQEVDFHIRQGCRLIREAENRHNYWMLTDCFLNGENEFENVCKTFDTYARNAERPTLEDIRFLLQVPSD
jgi:hypothetical protein